MLQNSIIRILISHKMNTNKGFLHWTPRILCILLILFISMFAMDSFAPGFTFWQQIAAFAIHLIPTFVLIGLLILSWKKEFIGGLIFTLIGIGLSPILFIFNYKMNHSLGMSLLVISTLTVPILIIGILFILSDYHKKRKSKIID